MADRKLDLFKLLDAISRKNVDYYHTLSDEEKKEVQPFVIMRWLTGTFSKQQVCMLNALVNPVVFSLQHHKDLLYNLLVCSSNGKQQRYQWNKPPGSNKKNKLAINVLCDYYQFGPREARDALCLLSPEKIIEYAEDLGWQKDDIAKLKKELKDGSAV